MYIFGIKIDLLSMHQVLNSMHRLIEGDKAQNYLVSVNPEAVLLAQNDNKFCEIINKASLGLVDGFGIMLAVRILGKTEDPLKPPLCKGGINRITGVDLMIKLCEEAACKGWRVYLAGGRGETAKRAANKLRSVFQGLIIDGEEGVPRSGNFQFPISNFQINSKFQINSNNQKLIDRINQFQPEILFVALGQPGQEYWIDENLKKLSPVRVAMGVGGAFDFIAGNVHRAPKLLRRAGLEWLWRLIVQPWRLPRIFNATVRFMWLVVRERLRW